MNNNKNQFEKTPLSIEAQLALLISRGITVLNQESAQHNLKFISFYRFCSYAIEFKDDAEKEKFYLKNTTFEQILNRYNFDGKLRLLTMNAIEKIEVAIRTVISNELALKYGTHWYLRKELFCKRFKFKELIEEITKHKKREPFFQKYFEKYSHPELPPIWMIAEVLSLGTWSYIFANLINRDDQKIICDHFDINYNVMTSWLHALTYLRNLCAHHNVLWNRRFTLKPIIAKKFTDYLKNNDRFAAQATIINIFLNVISPTNKWAQHLNNLINEYPDINIEKMGFDRNWKNDMFWNIRDHRANLLREWAAWLH